jgi:hypothetical protein
MNTGQLTIFLTPHACRLIEHQALPVLGMNFSATPLLHQRFPVGRRAVVEDVAMVAAATAADGFLSSHVGLQDLDSRSVAILTRQT